MDGLIETVQDAVLVVHGGAGRDIERMRQSPEHDAACRAGLEAALWAGFSVLQEGRSALDAVEAAVRYLEDDPNFNAGRGASLAYSGMAELDASIMDGATGQAGAVAGVTTVKNPITLARAVMEKSPFVFMVAPGAEEFADEIGVERVENSYFLTPGRIAQLERLKASGDVALTAALPTQDNQKLGTVGAAARDGNGNLAAATSTGGMGGKRFGRVGDSPLIGAGTWADNATCALSCTGHGEYFIRKAIAHDVAARMAYAGIPLKNACAATLAALTEAGGAGGFVALDSRGNAALPFNTPGMYRGCITSDGAIHIAIYADEEDDEG